MANDQENPNNENAVAAPYNARSYLDPIIGIAILILLAIFVLIGYSMIDKNGGLLARMADATFARGLITYLFAVVTMGTAVVIVISALTGGVTEADDKKFQRGKEILSLLLGVFGTIVGFYFGSELTNVSKTSKDNLHLSSILLDKTDVTSQQKLHVTASVYGGIPPYRYGLNINKNSQIDFVKYASENGWIIEEAIAPDVDQETTVTLYLDVIDATGTIVTRTVDVRVVPIDQ